MRSSFTFVWSTIAAMGLLAVVSCGEAKALVGSTTEPEPQEIAQTILVTNIKGRSTGFCTGVVIERDVVLTAAYCAYGASAIAVNAARPGEQPRLIEATAQEIHPEFQPDAAKRRVRSIDLVLLRLKAPLPKPYAPGQLATREFTKLGERFRILGFGLTREGINSSGGRLRAGELQTGAPLSRVLLWARDPLKNGFGACNGDAGGPILSADGLVFAITTWSTGEGGMGCGALTQAVLLAPHREWINGVLEGWHASANLPKGSPPTSHAPAPASPRTAAATPQPAARKTSSGSAFRIASGLFVTNHHVVNGCSTLKIGSNLGGRVIASDANKDLSLVLIENDSGGVASIRTNRNQLNETVTAAGFPLDGPFSGIAITNGTISRLSGLRGNTSEVQISAPVQPGNSGGPLLDTAANVIGVVSSKLNALKAAGALGDIPQNVNFAISVNTLRDFLDAHSVKYKEVGNERELPGVEIATRASAFTVLLECQKSDLIQQARPQPTPSAAPPRQVSKDGEFAVQLAAVSTEEEAMTIITRLKRRYSTAIGKRNLAISNGLWDDGTRVWRIRVPHLTKEDANSLCTNIKGAGGSCFVAVQ
jgi:V8-like Glu-specific endopeptidase